MCHVPYLRNSIAHDHDFWYTYVKWYLQAFFHFFEVFIFRAVRGVKGQKKPKMKNSNYICHGPYFTGALKHMNMIFDTLVLNDYISRCLFCFFDIFIFGQLGVKGQKMPKMKNNNYICHSPYLRNSTAYDHGFWHACVKWWYLKVCFSFFWYFHFSGF